MKTSSVASESNLEFVTKVDFGKNVEETLNFIGKVKGQMGDRYPYLSELLINKGTELIVKSFAWSKGNISRKLSDFIQASAAFIWISLTDLPPEKMITSGLNVAQVILMSNLPALAESVVIKVLDLLEQKSKEIKQQSFDQKQIFFDKYKSILNFLLVLPDSPETEPLSNLKAMVNSVTKMDLSGENRIFEVELLFCVIHHLAAQHQDQLPFRLKNVKSNDQLYRSQDFRNAVLKMMMSLFEQVFGSLEELSQANGHNQQAECCHMSLRCVNTLATSFKPSAAVNKLTKTCLNLAGTCIKLIKSKGDKRRTVRHLKRTIRELFLEDNPKIAKLASSLYTFFDEKAETK